MTNSWELGQPIFKRLPVYGYQDNEDVEAITTPMDEFLIGVLDALHNVTDEWNPETCREDFLDYLAALCGFIDGYWDKGFPVEAKRKLIGESFATLWPNRGSRQAIEFVLETLLGEENVDVWTRGEFLLDVTSMPGELSQPEWEYYIRVKPVFPREGNEFRLAERINYLYGVAHCESRVVYDAFYLELSLLGDLLF